MEEKFVMKVGKEVEGVVVEKGDRELSKGNKTAVERCRCSGLAMEEGNSGEAPAMEPSSEEDEDVFVEGKKERWNPHNQRRRALSGRQSHNANHNAV
ncbi:hypothetical protein LXL04_020163 [Taraxacum kok-saghyz]